MISWERLAGLSGLVFIVLFIVAFALGIEVGESDREILEYYADNGNILLVAATSLAALRHGVLPRWLGWAGLPAAALLAVPFVGFLVFAAWVLAVGAVLAARRAPQDAPRPVAGS